MRALVLVLLLFVALSFVPSTQAIPPVCTERTVGTEPAYVTVGYGGGIGCLGATVTTCELTYYPGEPNTPVWNCSDAAHVP